MYMKILFYFLLVIFFSCTSNTNSDNVQRKIEQLERENKDLKEKSFDNTSNDNFVLNSKKYAFVLLEVIQVETELDKSEAIYKAVEVSKSYNYCSGIEDFQVFNEDVKYKFMDEVQQEYMNMNGRIYKGRVKTRNCFSFDSYEAASKERERYLVERKK